MNVGRKHWVALFALVLLALGPVGAAWAQVLVTAADPSSATQGTTSLDVTISGSGFDSTAQVQFLVTGTENYGGIVVKKVSVRSSKRLVATIDVADTAVVDRFDIAVTLSGDRKGKGTTLFAVLRKTNDPCAVDGLDFPAFVFARASGTTQELAVSDATGTCVRPLYLVTDGYSAQRLAFSYPVDGTQDRGRVVWIEGSMIVAGDFTVAGTSVSVSNRRVLVGDLPLGTCCGLDLSANGAYIFTSTSEGTLARISVSDTSSRWVIKTLTDDGWFNDVSVNGDGSALYVVERRMANNQTGAYQLFRIDLSTLQSTLLFNDDLNPLYPAADLGSNRIAFVSYVAGSNNCYLLQIADGTNGVTISYGQPRYGRDPTWYRGKVLTYGYKLAKGGGLRCDATGLITEVDPLTSAEKPLVRGFYPDGR
jgi:hypothetical protein